MNQFSSVWQLLLHYLKPPRYLIVTSLGGWFIFLTIGVGLSAMNTGNNLVYMIFGMMLAFITASGIISEISLRHLDWDWILPSESYAEKPVVFQMIVQNKKKKLPSLALELTIKTNLDQTEKNKFKTLFFTYIPASSQKSFNFNFLPEKRGKVFIKEIKIETRFPFGFFRKYMIRPVEKSFVVYPKINSLQKQQFDESGMARSQPMPFKGIGDSFRDIRDFYEGDNPRQISWKNSAKKSRLMVRETEKESEKRIWIKMGTAEAWKSLSETELESAISFAASFIVHQFQENFSIGFMSDDMILVPSVSKKNLAAMLYYLALFDPTGKENAPKIFRKINPWESTADILSLWKKHRPIQ